MKLMGKRQRSRASIQTIIFDTSSLLYLRTPHVVPHPTDVTETKLLDMAGRAVIGAHHHILQAMRVNLPHATAAPAATYSGVLTGSAWPHGEHYELYWIGATEYVIQRCNLTENEREHLMTTVRQLGSRGQLVYAVATSTVPVDKHTSIAAAKPHALIFHGFITVPLDLHPEMADTVRRAMRQHIRLIYAATEPESLASAIAHTAGLLPRNILPASYNFRRSSNVNTNCYAGVGEIARQMLIKQFPSLTTLVTNQPLPSVLSQITR